MSSPPAPPTRLLCWIIDGFLALILALLALAPFSQSPALTVQVPIVPNSSELPLVNQDASLIGLNASISVPISGSIPIAWGLFTAIAGVTFLWNLRGVVRSINSGHPFERINARRLQTMAVVLAIYPVATVALQGWADGLVSGGLIDGHHVLGGFQVDFTPLAGALILLALAHVFARAADIQKDNDLTV